MQIAILDFYSGSVSLHTLPHHVKNEQDIRDYIELTLDVHLGDCEYMTADNIIVDDFRVGR